MAKPHRLSATDRVGERHGRLVVLFRAENKVEPSGATRAQWRCICDCGKGLTVTGHALAKGNTRSCGCLLRDTRKSEATHGMYRSAEYRIWKAMKQRCTNPSHGHYDRYGGRGITVCDAWMEFDGFFRDMGNRPEGATLERVDNDKGYEPGNVIWASRLAQANNRITNSKLEFRGRELTVAEWSRVTGLNSRAIAKRIASGWSVERALTEPLSRRK